MGILTREASTSSTAESRAAYWQRKFAEVPVLNLPTDRLRPAAPSGNVGVRSREVDAGLTGQLLQLSQNERVPFSIVLLSAFQILLLRYTAQEDVVTGCTLPDILADETGDLRHKSQAFLLRSDLSGDPPFRRMVSDVGAGVAGAAQHSSSSMADLVEEITSSLGVHAPTFQVSFSFRDEQSRQESEAYPESPGPSVDLHLVTEAKRESVALRVLYNSDLFEAGSVDRILSHLETLLRAAAQDPNQQIAALPLMTGQEAEQILVDWNQNVQDYTREKCLHQLVEEQVRRTPESIAVVRGNSHLTYRDLNVRANQLAHYLCGLGVGPNARVGLCLDPTFDFAVSLLGVMKAGGACVPLDPNYPAERLAYMIEDVQAQVLITQKGMLASAACPVLVLAELEETLSSQPADNPHSGVTADDVAYVIYTSGSTGKPRGVLLPHAGLVNYNTATSRMFDIGPSDRMLQFCSVSFDIAVEEFFATWMCGATLVLRTAEMSLAVPEFLSWIEQQRITILDLPTAYWHEWVHHIPELKRPVPPTVRIVIVGGERASAKACSAWSKAVDRKVRWVNTYGPTEASVSVTTFEPRFAAGDFIPENISIGRPLPNCRVYLLDQRLRPVPVGVPGELHVGGVAVARGYYNRPELTVEKFIADPFSAEPGARLYKTGDLARYLASGEIQFLGRTDDQVKIRGFRVELGEIEAALRKQAGVREVAVIAREDAPGEKRLVAYLVLKGDSKPATADLRRALQRQLPDYMVPSAFVVMEAMPLTPNGKISRRGLPAPQAETTPNKTAGVADAFQSRLIKIWEDVLGRKPIGLHDNFFELGGHSLLAARLMHRIGQTLGRTLPLVMLLEAPTVGQLAAALQQDSESDHWSSLVPIQPAGSHPPFFCVHGVGGNVVGFHELGRRMAREYPLYGLQSQGLDGKHACHKSIEDMARHYVQEIRSLQPNGPYFVGGFSLGGLVAYEMAQQLRTSGQEVGLLALFDTYPGNLKTTGASVLRLLLTPSWQHWSHDLPNKVIKRIRRSVKNWRVPKFLLEVRDSNAAAAERYQLRPYAGKAVLVRAGEKSLRSAEDPHAEWGRLIHELEIREIPGDHYEMLIAPQVERLAGCLKACIDQSLLSYEQATASGKVS